MKKIVEFSNFQLDESFNTPQEFYLTDDTNLPNVVRATFSIDDTQYVVSIEQVKFKNDGLYQVELMRVVSKKGRKWSFKPPTHIRPALSTLLKIMEATIPFLGAKLKGFVISMPKEVADKAERFAMRFIKKSYITTFRAVPVAYDPEADKGKERYIVVVRKPLNPETVFSGTVFKNYDFAQSSNPAEKQIPATVLDELKPKIASKKSISINPSKKFFVGDGNIEMTVGDFAHKILEAGDIKFKSVEKIIPPQTIDKMELYSGVIVRTDPMDAGHTSSSSLGILIYMSLMAPISTDRILFAKKPSNSFIQKEFQERKSVLKTLWEKSRYVNSSIIDDDENLKVDDVVKFMIAGFNENKGQDVDEYKFRLNRRVIHYAHRRAIGTKTKVNEYYNQYVAIEPPNLYNKDYVADNPLVVLSLASPEFKKMLDGIFSKMVSEPASALEIIMKSIKKVNAEVDSLRKRAPDLIDQLLIFGLVKENDDETVSIVEGQVLIYIQMILNTKYAQKWASGKSFSKFVDTKLGDKKDAMQNYLKQIEEGGKKVVSMQPDLPFELSSPLGGDILDIDSLHEQDENVSKKIYTIEKEWGFKEKLKGMKGMGAAKSYTGSDYGYINTSIRQPFKNFLNGNGVSMKDFENSSGFKKVNQIMTLFKNIDPLPEAIWVYRYTNLGGKFQVVNGEVSDEQLLKHNYIDPGIISTSISSTFTWGAKSFRLRIYVPKGSRVVPILNLSSHPSEQEIILPPMSVLKPLRVYRSTQQFSKPVIECVFMGTAYFDFMDKLKKEGTMTIDKSKIEESFEDMIREEEGDSEEYDIAGKYTSEFDSEELAKIEKLIQSGKLTITN